MLIVIMLALIMQRLFSVYCLVWCIKNDMNYIIYLKKIKIYKDTLHKYDKKDLKNILRVN